MRKRQPGFYVSVVAPRALSGKAVELLDGPWPSRAAAERRRDEISSRRPDSRPRPSVIEVAEDGVTVIRQDTGA